jgi:pilus assembly protein CpaB
MKTAPLISLGLSVVLGAGAVFVGRGYMSGSNSEATAQPVAVQAAPAIAMSTVMIAREDIAPGAVLGADMLEAAEWPSAAVPVGALTDTAELETLKYARGLIVAGEPILLAKLEEQGMRATLSASIAPGYRAVSIVVEDDTGVAGFVLPGDKVDVNAFIELSGDKLKQGLSPDAVRISDEVIAQPVLKNIKVLAVDQSFESGLEGAYVSSTVTLEVQPKDALALGAAAQAGTLGLSLIGREEDGLEIAEVQTPKPTRAKVRRVTPRAAKTTTVRVINGNEETRVTAPVATSAMTKGGAE